MWTSRFSLSARLTNVWSVSSLNTPHHGTFAKDESRPACALSRHAVATGVVSGRL
jgi:hypothetical protein